MKPKSATFARTVPADRAVIACRDAQADPPAPTKGALLTPAEAAAYLKKSLPALYAWARRHGIKSAIKGRSLRFRLDDLVLARAQQQPSIADLPLEAFREMARQHGRTH